LGTCYAHFNNVVWENDTDEKELIRKKIETDFEGGIRRGVNGTPTFFLNNYRISTYDETYESLLDAIQLESEMKLKS